MTFMYFMFLFMVFIGAMVFTSKRKHFLLMLLSLEYIVLALYGFLMLILNYYNFEYFFTMVFLVMSVCEGALGLAILVSLIRTHSSDYFQHFNILW